MESCGNCANAYDEGYTAGRADLDLANARVAVLREGLGAVAEGHSPWSYTEFGVSCSCGAPMDANEQCDVLRAILPALLASPDEAATKLLAVRDVVATKHGELGHTLAARPASDRA